MPELSDVSCHFDDMDTYDGYTGAFLFKGQLSSFVEGAREGSTNKKRTMSVRPGTAMPPRRLLKYFDELWMVGDGNLDGLYNQRMRQTYWITKVIDMAERLSPAQVCAGTAGLVMASSKTYLKHTLDYTTDADYDPQWEFVVCLNESVVKGEYLRAAGKLFRARSAYTLEGGFLLVTADELDVNARVAVSLSAAGAFDPVTETRIDTVTDTFGISFEPTKLFRFMSEADPRYLGGDATLVLAMPAPVGSHALIAGVTWKVLTCTPELDGWSLHIRRA